MKKYLLIIIGLLVLSQGYNLFAGAYDGEADIQKREEARQNEKFERAVFAGGCFWCMQPPFDYLDGVITTTAGYTGGAEKNPTYKEVSYGKTGHTEAVEVIYDPDIVTYDKLLAIYWMNIDPTSAGGQFVDRGKQYRPGIFYLNDLQKKAASASKDKLQKSGRFEEPIVVEITQAAEFWDAEEYHQMYYKKNPIRYKTYRMGSGRDQFIDKYWRQAKN